MKSVNIMNNYYISGEIMPEYVKIFFSSMADHYGAPLNGHSGVNGNNNSEQMMEGIVNTVFSKMENFRLFAHIKVISLSFPLLALSHTNIHTHTHATHTCIPKTAFKKYHIFTIHNFIKYFII